MMKKKRNDGKNTAAVNELRKLLTDGKPGPVKINRDAPKLFSNIDLDFNEKTNQTDFMNYLGDAFYQLAFQEALSNPIAWKKEILTKNYKASSMLFEANWTSKVEGIKQILYRFD